MDNKVNHDELVERGFLVDGSLRPRVFQAFGRARNHDERKLNKYLASIDMDDLVGFLSQDELLSVLFNEGLIQNAANVKELKAQLQISGVKLQDEKGDY